MDKYWKFNGVIDARNPPNEGDMSSPVVRENLLSRDGVLQAPPGTVKDITTELDARSTWGARYDTKESSIIVRQKSYAYTVDGKLWRVNEVTNTATEIKSGLNLNAYPKSWIVKTGTQSILYLVDGENLYKFDGNNDDTFEKVTVEDSSGAPVKPIDLIEHKERLILISQDFTFISKNLQYDIFDDATDSIQLIIGTGKGENLALGRIEGILFFLNTEGIFALDGDTISAVANTFGIVLVEERNIVAGRTAVKVEKAINFLAANDKRIELWSFNGVSSKLLTHLEKLNERINHDKIYLQKAVANYYDNYYMLSYVKNGETENTEEYWWDALGGSGGFVVGRDVSFYMRSDPTVEASFMWLGSSSSNFILRHAPGERTYNGSDISVYIKSKDLTIAKGRNVRITEMFPEIQTTGVNTILFRYLLDGRLSDLDVEANWLQALDGEAKILGLIRIRNQTGFVDRQLPKINYAKGVSITFEIRAAINKEFKMQGIGLNFIDKGDIKSKKVGA